jgi:predicted alpha/beta hydrolase
MSQLQVRARDGFPLAATLFTPPEEPDRALIIASATGVRRGLYMLFARYFAARGWAVLTFDYRGIGDSLVGSVNDSKATIVDWGRLDYAGVIDWMTGRFEGVPLHVVGHSIGGQLLGMLENVEGIRSACTVAAQNAYYRRYPVKQAVKYGVLWHLAVPAVVRTLGYFPAKRFRLGEDLPGGVALDWACFATHEAYLVDRRGRPLRVGFDTMRAPVLAFSFRDDHRAPAANIEALHGNYRRARVEYCHVDPADFGASEIGHMGFFSSAFRKSLWSKSMDWLVEAA